VNGFRLAVQFLNNFPHFFAVIDAGLGLKKQLLEHKKGAHLWNVVRENIQQSLSVGSLQSGPVPGSVREVNDSGGCRWDKSEDHQWMM